MSVLSHNGKTGSARVSGRDLSSRVEASRITEVSIMPFFSRTCSRVQRVLYLQTVVALNNTPSVTTGQGGGISIY